MPHPLVTQLRFARSEFQRGLVGLSDEDARRRFGPINCISWIIGHLASQEQAYWVLFVRGRPIYPELHRLVGTGRPATTPPLDEMWQTWQGITTAADEFLDTITGERLPEHFQWKGEPVKESIGTLLQRNIYHYWFHNGEVAAIRQMLGHEDLPQFVGDMTAAVYRPS